MLGCYGDAVAIRTGKHERRLVLRTTTRGKEAGVHLFMLVIGLYLAAEVAATATRILGAVIAAAGAILLVRGTRTAIWVSQQGVTVAGNRVTKHLAWTGIQRFDLDPADQEGLILSAGLGAWRHNGEWVRLVDHGRHPRGRYQAALEDLQTELADRQS